MDEPAKWLGSKHRQERHNPFKSDFWTTILEQTGIESLKDIELLFKKDPTSFVNSIATRLLNNTRNALTHTLTDEISSFFKNLFNFERDDAIIKEVDKIIQDKKKVKYPAKRRQSKRR